MSSLYAKLVAMSNRICALENALQIECTARQTLEHQLSKAEDTSQVSEERAANALESLTASSGGPSSLLDKASPITMHALLAPDLLDIKKGMELLAAPSSEGKSADEAPDSDDESISEMIDTFGMLAIQNGHNAHLVGASATEVCFFRKARLDKF